MIFKRKINNLDYLDEADEFGSFPKVKKWKVNVMDLMRTLKNIFFLHLCYVIDIEKTN